MGSLALAEKIFKAAQKHPNEKPTTDALKAVVKAEKGLDIKDVEALLREAAAQDGKVVRTAWDVAFVNACTGSRDKREYILELVDITPASEKSFNASAEVEQARVTEALELCFKLRVFSSETCVTLGNEFQKAELNSEALILFRRSCKLLAAAQYTLFEVVNCRHATKSQKDALRRNLCMVFFLYSVSVQKMALLAQLSPYLNKVTVDLCHKVAWLCADQARDMNKWHLKARVDFIKCLMLCGKLIEDETSKGAPTELKILREEVKSAGNQFFPSLKKTPMGEPDKSSTDPDHEKKIRDTLKQLLNTHKLRDRINEKVAAAKEKQETKAQKGLEIAEGLKKKAEKERKLEEQKEQKKQKKAEEAAINKILGKSETPKTLKSKKKSKKSQGTLSKTSSDDGEDLGLFEKVTAGAILSAVVIGTGFALWKLRHRLTKSA